MTGGAPSRESDRLLPWAAVRDMTGISRTTAWRLQRNGDFPVCVQVSPGRVCWWESELARWKSLRAPRRLPESRPFLTPVEPATQPVPTPCRPAPPRPERLPEKPRLAAAASPHRPRSRPRKRASIVCADQTAFDF